MFLFTKSWVIFKSSYPSLTQPPPSPHHLLKVHSTLFTTLKLICDVEIHLINRFNVASITVSRAITSLAMTNADFAVEIINSSFVFSGVTLGWTGHPPTQKIVDFVRLSLFFLITHDTNEDEYECCWIDLYWPSTIERTSARRIRDRTTMSSLCWTPS